MRIQSIENAREHQAALKKIEELWGSKPGTIQGGELEYWVTLVEAFEDKRYPIEEK